MPLGGSPVPPDIAARTLGAQFALPVLLPADIAAHLPTVLATAGISGGAVYDALVGLAAREAGLPLLTRDGRALPTYAALGVQIELLAE